MANKTDNLEMLQKHAASCKLCPLAKTRTNVVFGEGNPNARIMFIGEGPGREEDLTGRPFVGKAGDILTMFIENTLGLPRSEVYIANIVKCRPTVEMKMEKDRPPTKEETATCSPFLLKQIEIIQPQAIITLGNPSTQFLLKTKIGITKIHGTWHSHEGIPVMPTFHPSYILRNGGEKSPLRKVVEEDIQKVMDRLNIVRAIPS